MIAEERIGIINNLVLRNLGLTRANLISNGLSNNDIYALIKNETLIRVGRGCYELNQNYENYSEIIDNDEPLLDITLQNNDLQNIEFNLINKDYESAFKSIYSYLDFINKANYKSLIINFVKICLLENDLNFAQVMDALTSIRNNSFSFNLANYINYFYDSFAHDSFDKALIYFDIIRKSETYGGQKCFLTRELKTILEKTINSSNYKGNESISKVDLILQKIENNEEEILENVTESFPSYTQDIDESYMDCSNIGGESDNINFNELVKEKRYELQASNGGLILLPPMKKNEIKYILEAADTYDDIYSYEIQTDDGSQVVLEYKGRLNEYINYNKVMSAFNKAKSESNYILCIELLKKIICAFKEPSPIVYGKIGIAYRDNGDYENAIAYLTVATALSKQEGTDLDYSRIICELKKKLQSSSDNSGHVKTIEPPSAIERFNNKWGKR